VEATVIHFPRTDQYAELTWVKKVTGKQILIIEEKSWEELPHIS